MNPFTYEYPVHVHFDAGSLEKALVSELPKYGKHVLLAYGGGSIKRTGLYDKLKSLLAVAGKEVYDFGGIMSNPTYAKVQEGAKLAREHKVDFILAVIHPALYRHLAKAAPQQFARLATEVFGVDAAGRSEAELALALPEALAAFIKEIGMPTTLRELGMQDESLLKPIAAGCVASPGSYRQMGPDEIYQVFKEAF